MILGKSIPLFHSGNYISIFSFRNKKNVQTKSHAQKEEPVVGTRSHAARINTCGAAILAANKQTAGFVCTTSTASCLRPTFTRFTYSPKSWPHAGFRIKQ